LRKTGRDSAVGIEVGKIYRNDRAVAYSKKWQKLSKGYKGFLTKRYLPYLV
jgi:hypothetical protein